jgi:hypothetical protein
MMISGNDHEARRLSPLAFWRYGHDYLRAARTLCRQHRIPCTDAQVAYHAAAQGIEFALKAFLRARGVAHDELSAGIGHSLATALAWSEAQGMAPIPDPWRAAVAEIAPCHQDGQFVYLVAPPGAFPDVDPLVAAGVFVLDAIAPDVATHFVAHLGGEATPTVEMFVRRLRADLTTTFEITAPGNDPDRSETQGGREPGPGASRLYA